MPSPGQGVSGAKLNESRYNYNVHLPRSSIQLTYLCDDSSAMRVLLLANDVGGTVYRVGTTLPTTLRRIHMAKQSILEVTRTHVPGLEP